MIIKKLIVENGLSGEEIRNIDFDFGINLIVDDGTDGEGNSVGKTTVLRCIDYCLGSSGEDIYQDQETKTPNNTILSFLINYKILISLIIEDNNGKQYLLRRNFITRGKDHILEINEEKISSIEKYLSILNNLLFGLVSKRPTFREMISKFIRTNVYGMQNLLYFLHAATSKKDYQRVHLPLFGFNDMGLLETQFIYSDLVSKSLEELGYLNKVFNFDDNGMSELIAGYKEKLLEIKTQISNIDILKGNEDLLNRIDQLRSNIANISSKIADRNTEIVFSKKSMNRLEKEKMYSDKEFIKGIYTQAKIFIPDLQKSFEEVVKFHSNLVNDRLGIVRESLQESIKELDKLKDYKSKLLEEEKSLLKLIGGDYDSDLEVMRESYKQIELKKLQCEENLDMRRRADEKLTKNENLLKKVNLGIKERLVKVQENDLKEFNAFFRKYSEYFCGSSLFLSSSFDEKDKIVKFKLNNSPGNEGTGEKKAQISAFDMAYAEFLYYMKTKGPRFILHDNIEATDDQHLKKIFETAKLFHGQYIVSIIYDRVKSFLSKEEIEALAVISLDKQNKFFKMESFLK